MGGFGRVYQHPVSQSSFVAVKEEKKVVSIRMYIICIHMCMYVAMHVCYIVIICYFVF